MKYKVIRHGLPSGHVTLSDSGRDIPVGSIVEVDDNDESYSVQITDIIHGCPRGFRVD